MTTLLWIHGLGESSACFDAVLRHPRLAGHHHRAPDLPGYGAAPPDDPPRDLAGVADRIAGELAARGGPPPVLVGHSMGGVIGLLVAERHPGALAGLVNVDGNVSPGDCTYSGRAAAHELAAFRAGGFASLQAFVAERGATDVAHRGYAAHMAQADAATFHLHARDLVAISAREDVAARLAALRVPVTYVAGAPGGACARSRELLDAAGVRRIDVAPAGHWPFIDQPDRFAEVVARVVAELG